MANNSEYQVEKIRGLTKAYGTALRGNQRRLAEMLGVSPATISFFIKNGSGLGIDKIEVLERFFENKPLIANDTDATYQTKKIKTADSSLSHQSYSHTNFGLAQELSRSIVSSIDEFKRLKMISKSSINSQKSLIRTLINDLVDAVDLIREEDIP